MSIGILALIIGAVLGAVTVIAPKDDRQRDKPTDYTKLYASCVPHEF